MPVFVYRQEFHTLFCVPENRRGYITRQMETFDMEYYVLLTKMLQTNFKNLITQQ
jgi:hypothetical protein